MKVPNQESLRGLMELSNRITFLASSHLRPAGSASQSESIDLMMAIFSMRDLAQRLEAEIRGLQR